MLAGAQAHLRQMKGARMQWRDVVLICRKCGEKAGGGYGGKGRKSLKQALRKSLKLGKGRCADLALIEVDCLKLCPKGAVTVVRGSAPGRMLALPTGLTGAEAVDSLGLCAAAAPSQPQAANE